MLSFKFFNKDKSEEVNVKVESDNKSMDDIKAEADKACLKTYNRSVVRGERELVDAEQDLPRLHRVLVGLRRVDEAALA